MKGILKKDSQINSDSRYRSFLRQEDNAKERLRKEAQNIKMEVKINFHAKPSRTHAQKMLNAISDDVLHVTRGSFEPVTFEYCKASVATTCLLVVCRSSR